MHHYLGCGLKNVWLHNGYKIHKTPYGEGVSIHDLEGLHHAIALRLIFSKAHLTGPEFRFLRKELKLTQARLAELMGNDAQTIALWERHGRVTNMADRFIRMLYLNMNNRKASWVELIDRLNGMASFTVDEEFEETKKGWLSKVA